MGSFSRELSRDATQPDETWRGVRSQGGEDKQVKIAYVVVAHKNPQLLKRAIRLLASENCTFFIHIDLKSRIEDFCCVHGEDVFFSEKRIPVYWGEFSQVEAMLLLLRLAMKSRRNYDYFILLSGSDYPLRSGKYIRAFLERNRGMVFIDLVKMPVPGNPISRINTLRFQSTRPIRRFAYRVLAKFALAQRDYRKYLGDLEPYCGDTWALTRDACQYILTFVERNPNVTRYFRDTHAPDEMFFQTILGNSAFVSRIRRGLHYMDWSARGAHPAMITDQHVAFFESQDKIIFEDRYGSGEVLFARKFSDDNLAMLERIDEMIRRREKD